MSDLNLIKKLRELSGCGIGDCSKALKENNNDIETSLDWLRKKGLSSASKKSGRVASEGLVSVRVDGNKASIIEVNSETDFVARNEKFQQLVSALTKLSIGFGNDAEKLKSSNFNDTSHNIDEEIKNQIGVIGENINLRRIDNVNVDKGAISSYIHNAVSENMGKIAVLVALESDASLSELSDLGKKIAMHIAAAKPEFLSIQNVKPEKLERETAIFKEQARASGKPENIVEKMVEGRIRKYYEEVVLLEQNFVMDDKVKIKDLISDFSKKNSDTKLVDYKLFILGEGIEKKENNFAEEVSKMQK